MYSQETNKANTVAVCKRQGIPLRDVQFCAEFVSLVHILFIKKKTIYREVLYSNANMV